MKKFKLSHWHIFWLIIVASFIPRLLLVNDSLFHFDSVTLANAVQKSLQDKILYRDHAYSYLNVLVNMLFHKFWCLFGINNIETALKLNTILFSSLCSGFMFLFIKNKYNISTGVFAGLILSFTPVFFSVSTFPLNHSLAILFFLVSYYFLHKKKPPYILSGIFSSLGILIRFDYVFFLIPLVFYLLKKMNYKKIKSRQNIRLLASIIIPTIVMVCRLLIQGEYVFGTMGYQGFYFNLFNIFIIFSYSIKAVTIFALIFSIFGLLYLSVKKRYYDFYYYLLWILIPLLYFSNLVGTKPRYLIPVFIPMIVLNALSIDVFYNKSKRAGILILIFLLVLMFLSIYPTVSFRHKYSTAKEFAKLINRTTEPNSVLILYGDDVPLMHFYAQREYLDYVYGNTEKDLMNFLSSIFQALESGKPVYLSETVFNLDSRDRGIYIFAMLQKNFKLTQVDTLIWENPHAASVMSQKFNVSLIKIER
ncbi:glycosyltransferase family 39 protein [Candidatus Woesearchaeota archaeon]|nr:glycosyltransferase family 39 protein [Candidatus Woesearchaeota archaeon]